MIWVMEVFSKNSNLCQKTQNMGKNSGFSLKTQHGGSLRLLSGAPQPLKKKPVLNKYQYRSRVGVKAFGIRIL